MPPLAPPRTDPSKPADSETNSLSGEAIAGTVIGVLLVLAITGLGYRYRRHLGSIYVQRRERWTR